MKKNIFIITMIIVSCFIFIGCGKKAEPINLPNEEDIVLIQVMKDNNDFKDYADNTEINNIITKIRDSVPTRKESVQDSPYADVYYTVNILTSDITPISLFIYKEKSKWYIEQPYQGIYITDEEILSFIGIR